ncbi:MAG: UDP-N-acetylmuramoyl-L-alanyl-D-glutamate--2,6-diaminopimelate ligase [Halocynthiibacter sp.]
MQDAAGGKTLSELGFTGKSGANPFITGLAVDSRNVKEGFLFAALPGAKIHGGEFIQYALRMNAAAILTDREGAEIAKDELAASDATLIVVDDPRQSLAYAAALFFGGQPEVMIAVTGTNGKTSVSSFARQIWMKLGIMGANLGTTGVEGAFEKPLNHTTPEPITLHGTLAEMKAAGITHASMEASSHGLDQKRLDGVQLNVAGFTNFTQDHLDYHHTFEAYFDAKMGLFERVLPDGAMAVINIDDPMGQNVVDRAQRAGATIVTVGRHKNASLYIENQRCDETGQDIRFHWLGEVYQTRLNLIGDFQADNVMLAAAMVIASGVNAEQVFKVLPELETVRGRMEHAATRDNGAPIFVDYAHTPDAVKTALRSMRPHVMGRIIAVVGAGGDRDPIKRPLMGEAAAQNADVVFVTDDNPRTENPISIRKMVMDGCPEGIEVGDRAEAILRAVDALQAGDALLIAGKGHETGQIVGDQVLPFDDVEQASIAVEALEGRLG